MQVTDIDWFAQKVGILHCCLSGHCYLEIMKSKHCLSLHLGAVYKCEM